MKYCWDLHGYPSSKGTGKFARQEADHVDDDQPGDDGEVQSAKESTSEQVPERRAVSNAVEKRKLRDRARAGDKLMSMAADYESGKLPLPFKPVLDPDERMVRKALASAEGTDGGASIKVVTARVASLNKSVSGLATNGGLFTSSFGLDLSSEVYTDLRGEERVKMAVDMNVTTQLDMTKEEFDRDPQSAIRSLKGSFVDCLKYVVGKVESSIQGYLLGQNIEKLQCDFEAAPSAEELKDILVAPEESAGQTRSIEEMNAKLLRERAEMRSAPGAEEDDRSTCPDDGTVAKSEFSDKGSEIGGPGDNAAEGLKVDEEEPTTPVLPEPKKEDELQTELSADMKVDLSSSEGATSARSVGLGSAGEPTPREAVKLLGSKKKAQLTPSREKLYGGGQCNDHKVYGGRIEERTRMLGTMEHFYYNEHSNQQCLRHFLCGEEAQEGLLGFHDGAPVTTYWPHESGVAKDGQSIEKAMPGPVSDVTGAVKGKKAKTQPKPFEKACTGKKGLFVERERGAENPRAWEQFDVIPYGDDQQCVDLKESMTAEDLAVLKPRRYERLLRIPPGGAAPPNLTAEDQEVMANECLVLELVHVDRTKPAEVWIVWYVRCTCCRVGFPLWEKCRLEEEEKSLNRADWRSFALKQSDVVRHLSSSEHVVTFAEYAEPLTAVLGPLWATLGRGLAQRHLRKSPLGAGALYWYRGLRVDSPTLEAAPLPTKESVRDSMGRTQGLLPVVWQRAKEQKIRLQVQGRHGAEFVVIGTNDIKALHAGVIYWGMEQMANQYQHTRRLMPCVYVDLTRLPETNDEYLESRLGVYPTAEDPHPELALLTSAMDKIDALAREPPSAGKKSTWNRPEPTSAEWAVYKLPPATKWQSWYPVVRIELQEKSRVWKVGKNICPICCMVQIVEWEEEYLTAWNLGIAKFGLSDEVLGALERCTKGLHEHMTIENS